MEIKKTTGTPDVKGVTEIQLDTNLTLTDNGNGGVTIQSSGGGGGSGVTSVGLTETGDALTITNSPITTSGDINIAGAGSSSQVILGDLSLGTLPTPSNPTATIGATANNGSATTTTFMRSDATPALGITGVTAATYGSSTTVGQFTVDATGRITSAANVTISGGGGGGGYPLFKHDEAPTNTNFDPFRLWVNNAIIELGVSSGGEGADADVSVFTPAAASVGSVPLLATITGIGSESTNTGREYVFYGDDYKQNFVQYLGGIATQTLPPTSKQPVPLYFVNSMREVVSPPSVFIGNSNLVIYSATTDAGENPYPSTSNGVNCVRVIDAGTHLVFNGSTDGGQPEPEEPSNVRILLIVDAPPALFNGRLGVNYGLVPSAIV